MLILTRPELPQDTVVEDIRSHGISYWTRTAEISTHMADGTPRSYYLKVKESLPDGHRIPLTAMLGVSRQQWERHGYRRVCLHDSTV
jgi:hypothetical protein